MVRSRNTDPSEDIFLGIHLYGEKRVMVDEFTKGLETVTSEASKDSYKMGSRSLKRASSSSGSAKSVAMLEPIQEAEQDDSSTRFWPRWAQAMPKHLLELKVRLLDMAACVPCDRSACCLYHYALNQIQEALNSIEGYEGISSTKCHRSWTPNSGWQCRKCFGLNPETCDVENGDSNDADDNECCLCFAPQYESIT